MPECRPTHKKCALFIDDERHILEGIRRNLRSLADVWDLKFQDDPMGALDNIQKHTFDLIVCDLQMPQIDGIEFLRHIAEADQNVSVALMSGAQRDLLSAAKLLAETHGLKVLAVLEKPVSPSALQALMRKFHPKPPKPTRFPYLGSAAAGTINASILAEATPIPEFQPKIDLHTGRVVGAEALMRLHHPKHGLIMAESAVPSAAAAGLLPKLTRAMLWSSLEAANWWAKRDMPISVSVNFSIRCLEAIESPAWIMGMLTAANVEPTRLTIEVTETDILRQPARAMETLTRLRLRGIGIAIDDFGTGHASLAQLKNFPFTELKIDRSFVAGVAADGRARSILHASSNLAQSLGLTVVAEGVETESDLSTVMRIGCNQAQGFYLARPTSREGVIHAKRATCWPLAV